MKPIYLIFILLVVRHSNCSFGLDVISMVSGVVSLGAAFYKSIDRYLSLDCFMGECCSVKKGENDWIPLNMKGLSKSLQENLHGQHLVSKVVPRAIKSHFSSNNPKKALVMSFHGWTGGGKNYVAKMIADSMFKEGMKSKYVHLFVSTVNFPHSDQADIYKLQIQDWIRGNVSKCEISLFIFDEIDKMPQGMIDGIKPFIDYHENIFGIDFRKSVFLFLSNTGSKEISFKMFEHWRSGKNRNDVTYADMEELILKGAFNENGGLHESDLIDHSLIDYYIPFLPLEHRHVELCIKDELKRRKVKPNKELVEKLANEMTYFPPESRIYSTKGCKNVFSKVGFALTEKFFDEL